MKYIVVLGDGMADLPIDEFSGQTPMEAAEKPYMNYLAAHGTCGMAKPCPTICLPAAIQPICRSWGTIRINTTAGVRR